MWDLIKVGASSPNLVSEYLAEGYEPFAATVDKYDKETIWMKKEVHEIYSQPNPDQGTGRRTVAKTKR